MHWQDGSLNCFSQNNDSHQTSSNGWQVQQTGQLANNQSAQSSTTSHLSPRSKLSTTFSKGRNRTSDCGWDGLGPNAPQPSTIQSAALRKDIKKPAVLHLIFRPLHNRYMLDPLKGKIGPKGLLAAGVLPAMAGLSALISGVLSKKKRKQEGSGSHSVQWHEAANQPFLHNLVHRNILSQK